MVTGLLAPRVLDRAVAHPAARVGAVTSRNLTAIKHSGYWLVLISGLFEPALYLFSIGIGVGHLVSGFTLPDGRTVTYAAFVAPAMLAVSAMNGAMTESTFNFFAKLKWGRIYDAVLATPVRPFEIALGELGWAMIRGSIYTSAFLAMMLALHLTTIGWAVLTFFATLLVGFAFGTIGMAIATLMRTWQDFDYLNLAMFALFLFSATFVPITTYPPVMRAIVAVTPLYQSVQLIRGLSTGTLGIGMLGNIAYLAVMSIIGVLLASRRMRVLLYK